MVNGCTGRAPCEYIFHSPTAAAGRRDSDRAWRALPSLVNRSLTHGSAYLGDGVRCHTEITTDADGSSVLLENGNQLGCPLGVLHWLQDPFVLKMLKLPSLRAHGTDLAGLNFGTASWST